MSDPSAVFPLLADPGKYKACEWDLTADGPKRAYWLQLFRDHMPSILDYARRQAEALGNPPPPEVKRRQRKASEHFDRYLDAVEARPDAFGPLNIRTICIARQDALKAAGLPDPYALAKQQENQLALKALPALLAELDALAPDDRAETVIRGVFAGNIYDLGAVATLKLFENGGVDFRAVRQKLKPRPWFMDNLDAWLSRLRRGPAHRAAVMFVDNAGSDIVLGMIPLARELLSRGTQVIVTANSEPALNDVTHEELVQLVERVAQIDACIAEALQKQRLELAPSGNTTPLIDLTEISPQLAAAVQRRRCDLVILEGMGRAVETNLSAPFCVDCLKLAMLKDQGVASAIGASLYDLLIKYEPVNAGA